MRSKDMPWNPGEEKTLSHALLEWFEEHGRPLPWRKSYHPYEVWISEVMLQQTQMERGVGYFLRWMKRFPDVAAVAAASEEDILHTWEGLGYYRRARFLHAAAKVMVAQHNGHIPQDPDALAALPGLGTYTVAAIRAVAFEHDVVVVDANVERVFSRLLDLDLPPRKKQGAAIIREAALRLLPPGQARAYNQALMELGALVCGKSPRCDICPVSACCVSHRRGVERLRPVQEKKPETILVTSGHGLLVINGRVLLRKRSGQGLWAGLWEFPGTQTEEGEDPRQAALRGFILLGIKAVIPEGCSCAGKVRHSYTNHRLTAHFYTVEVSEYPQAAIILDGRDDLQLVNIAELGEVAMPAHHRKLASRFFGAAKDAPRQMTFEGIF